MRNVLIICAASCLAILQLVKDENLKKLRPLYVAIILLFAGYLLSPTTVSQAASGQYSGSNVGGPGWSRPFANGTCCSGLGPVAYQATLFHVDVAGNYDFSSVQNGWDGYMFVYFDPFDPTNQTANFVAGDDDGNGGIGTSDLTAGLMANVNYVVVTTGFANGDEGSFTNTISGPGNVIFGGVTPPGVVVEGCTLVVPEGSVVGDTPYNTQVYYEPGNVSPGVFLNPGTYIVLGQDESETYYKIMLACQFVWVRKENMQPSYAPPQNGDPLPTRIVD